MFSYAKYNVNNDGVDFGTVDNCPFLQTMAQILRPYVTPTNANDSKLIKYYQRYGYHYGVDLVPYNESKLLTPDDYAIPVYSPALGIVLSTDEYTFNENPRGDATKSVVVQFDADTSFRVGKLVRTTVKPGDAVSQWDIVGYAKKWVHFEMLSYYKEHQSSQLFTFDKLRLYLVNPATYFNGKYDGLDSGIG